jgi:thiamine-phosphate pyrophosphorylase
LHSTVKMSLVSKLGEERRRRLQQARLYLVCDCSPGGRDLSALLPALIASGVQVVQLRDKQADEQELYAVARQIKPICERLGALLIINDHPMLAREAQADGVHVGQDDMPVQIVRELVGPQALIGLSTHAAGEIDRARSQAIADYLGVGPVYRTPTKPGRAAVGLELVRYAARCAQLPFFAIGAINVDNLDDVLGAGARAVAVVRAITEAQSPVKAAKRLSDKLSNHPAYNAIAS